MSTSNVAVQRLRELFNYDSETGTITRRVAVNSSDLAGHVAGRKDRLGYVVVSVDYVTVFAHRVAWALVNGDWPKLDVDHINGVVDDNRIANLREVSRSHNLQNQRKAHKDSASGYLGVKMRRGKKKTSWESRIFAEGKSVHLGSFGTPEEAHHAYVKAKRVLHPGNRL